MGRFCPPSWTTESTVSIDISQINRRKLGLHVNSGHVSPWWDASFCTLDECTTGTVTNSTISFSYAQLPFLSSRHCLNFGLFNKIDEPQEFRLSLHAENVESKDDEED